MFCYTRHIIKCYLLTFVTKKCVERLDKLEILPSDSECITHNSIANQTTQCI